MEQELDQVVQSKFYDKYSIGKSQRSHMRKQDTPGPGQYYHHESSNYKFAYTKEQRSKDVPRKDPGPGRIYYF